MSSICYAAGATTYSDKDGGYQVAALPGMPLVTFKGLSIFNSMRQLEIF